MKIETAAVYFCAAVQLGNGAMLARRMENEGKDNGKKDEDGSRTESSLWRSLGVICV